MNTRNVLKKQDTSEAFGWYCITLLAELELLVAYFLNVNLTLAYEHEMSNFFRECRNEEEGQRFRICCPVSPSVPQSTRTVRPDDDAGETGKELLPHGRRPRAPAAPLALLLLRTKAQHGAFSFRRRETPERLIGDSKAAQAEPSQPSSGAATNP
ncbi:unnamed protein product [Heligmosomoides polygyrus]|uniref:Uncharacterized protein n=1 Tax=Heligmosomoides polygyrus TaxID=6339 RepID=A0A183GK93_HELPZ|nr:unnamed protein product [Heligmosomoides polygyrus]